MHGEKVASGAAARRQHRAVALRRAGPDGRDRQPAHQADPGADGVRSVLVHPHIECSTRKRASMLSRTVTLSDVVWQQANLAGFLAGCFTRRSAADRASSLEDVVIEPQRQDLIPGFVAVKDGRARVTARSAARSPAPGRRCSPGPRTRRPPAFATRMVDAFAAHGLATRRLDLPRSIAVGAHVVDA